MTFNLTEECYECVEFLQETYDVKPVYNDVFKAIAFKHKDDPDTDFTKTIFPKKVLNALKSLCDQGRLEREKTGINHYCVSKENIKTSYN